MKESLSANDKRVVGCHFETKCAALQNFCCPCCLRVGIHVIIGSKRVCKDCGGYNNPSYFVDKGALPLWYDNEKPQYHIPEELDTLSLAEKMLIQRASPFVPLRHIKNGIFGLAGHVCTFPQDIEKFVNTLPRHKNDVTMISVLKTVQAEVGDMPATATTTYRVHKEKVGKALRWL